jgi:hypothetical protein
VSKSHGTGPSGGDARKTAGASIRRIGGISEASFSRDVETFRKGSLAFWRKAFKGKTPEEATKLATSLKAPVLVGVHAGGRVEVIDGRHRLTAAKRAGAKSIRAKVIVYGPRGGIVRTYVGKVPL